ERLREPDERLLVVILTHVEPADVVIRPREAGVDGDRFLVGIERVSRLVQAVLEPPPGDVEGLRDFEGTPRLWRSRAPGRGSATPTPPARGPRDSPRARHGPAGPAARGARA